MLLEVLSDFQISIPELGVIEATHPADRRPHLEQLPRAHRGAQAPLPLPLARLPLGRPRARDRRLHAPELDEGLARRLVEIVHMVRALDLKKPPSIAESIDWARTLLLIGADDIDRETFEQSMSILVKHRSDIDLVAERVSVKLEGDGVTGGLDPARLVRELSVWHHREQPARLLRGPPLGGRRRRHVRDPRRLRRARRGELDRPARLPRVARCDDRQVAGGPARSSSCSSTATSSAPPRPRRSSAGSRTSASRAPATGSTSTSSARRSAARSSRATTARCATSRASR